MSSGVLTNVTRGRWVIPALVGLGATLVVTIPVEAQQHGTGLAVTKSCPSTANQGDTVQCTATIENQDPDHGVSMLVVTNQVPFPGGPITQLSGCAAALAAQDATAGSGPDFTSCTFDETLDFPCPGGLTAVVVDRVVAQGVDADPLPLANGGFGGLPVTASTTNSILVTCLAEPPTTSAPLLSWIGSSALLLALVGGGIARLRRHRPR